MEKTTKAGLLNRTIALVAAFTLAMTMAIIPPASSTAQAATTSGDLAASAIAPQYYSYTTATVAPTAKPANKVANYEVYSTYFNFSIGVDGNLVSNNLYMELCPVGKPWSKARTIKFSSYMQTYKVSKLKSNTLYKTRLYYGLSTTVKGPYSKTIKFKTGVNAKPAVKSVTTKITNLKRTKKRFRNWYWTGYRWFTTSGHYYVYKYNVKTTVKLKSIPKANYLIVNGKWLKLKKGKKTYSVITHKNVVRYYTSPKKTSYKVTVYSAKAKSYKGYSKYWQKTKKLA